MPDQKPAIAKPARLIEKQSARIRELEADVARLTREVDRLSAEERAATSSCEQFQRLYRDERDERIIAEEDIASVTVVRDAALAERDGSRREAADLRDQLSAANDRAVAAETAVAELRAAAADLVERERTIAEREHKLTELVDRHQERMRRRALAEANALLNRAAVRGLLPGGGR